MGISFADLPPKAREQAMIKLAIQEARRRSGSGDAIKMGRKQEKEPQKSKYRAKKVEGCLIDGTPHVFDSIREFDRYQELALLQRSGEIDDLRVQVPFELIPPQKKPDGKKERPCVYKADFVYRKDGETVVEDAKGVRTKEYIIKRKLMLWVHHISVREV